MACTTNYPVTASKGRNGFTLAEMLIVVAIITVLVAVGIPVFVSRLAGTRETVCLSNRRSLTRQLQYEMMTEGLTAGQAEDIKNSFDAICPEGGVITIKLKPDVSVEVFCSIHGTGEGEGDEESEIVSVRSYLQNFIDFVNDNHDTIGNSNDRLRDQFFEEYGHPTMVIDGVTYYIEPFFNQHSSGEFSERIWLFAKTTSGNGNWNGSFAYHAENGQWYQAMRKYDGAAPQSAYIGGFENVSDLLDALEHEKCNKGDANRWRPVPEENITYSN
ncbi:MAG: prepilin-type N-terminal cleavage/methylation domain-containing protein [Clostridium sp.]|nr:prepilin-type N-terminal cleavage/methylation domain-containing protein [Clostridium sp.]